MNDIIERSFSWQFSKTTLLKYFEKEYRCLLNKSVTPMIRPVVRKDSCVTETKKQKGVKR